MRRAACLTVTCPDWCAAPHGEGDTFHFQADDQVTDVYGKDIAVSAFRNDSSGNAGVYVGDLEFPVDQLAALKAAIERAERALRS